MSVLSNYIEKEQMLKQLQKELEALQNNKELQKELEFKEKLTVLMTEYGKISRDVCALLDPSYVNSNTKNSKKSEDDGRRKRTLKIYKNPHTQEIVETRGGNNKRIQEWKSEFGNEEVVSWIIDEKA